MLNDPCGAEATETVMVAAIVTATVLSVLYTIYTTLNGKFTDLLNAL